MQTASSELCGCELKCSGSDFECTHVCVPFLLVSLKLLPHGPRVNLQCGNT